ncbi:MAG: trigger factor [Lachnospiraceae bacterium]|nr:trigger factor [Lachnospiraceae bacterium]
MKRKVCIVLLSLCMAAAATGCGGKEKDSSISSEKSSKGESTAILEGRLVSVSDKEIKDYVKLGDYKGITVDKTIQDVTEDDIDMQIDNVLSASAEEVEDAEAKVVEGDIVNIDFVGKKDGKAFDGGTSQDYDLSIGSGQFIDGFEDGLIGAKKGETRDLNLTFPEEYGNEELNGQEVVFTVSVNAIKRIPELTEEWVKNNTESKNIEEYRKSVQKELEESNKLTADSSVKNTAWNQVVEESEIKEYPDEDLKGAIKEYKDSINDYADQMGQSVEEFLKSQNMTQEQIDEESQQYAESKLKQSLTLQAIMDQEGFSLSDEEMKKTADQMVKDYDMTLDELAEQYGEQSVRENVALTRVMDFIVENAEVNTVAGASDGKEGILIDEDSAEDEEETEED